MHPVLESTVLRGTVARTRHKLAVFVKLVKRGDHDYIVTRTANDTVDSAHLAWDHLPQDWPDGYLAPFIAPHSSFWKVADYFGAPHPASTKQALHEFDAMVYAEREAIRYDSRCHCIQCEQLGGDCEYAPTYEDWLDEVENPAPMIEAVPPMTAEEEAEDLPF